MLPFKKHLANLTVRATHGSFNKMNSARRKFAEQACSLILKVCNFPGQIPMWRFNSSPRLRIPLPPNVVPTNPSHPHWKHHGNDRSIVYDVFPSVQTFNRSSMEVSTLAEQKCSRRSLLKLYGLIHINASTRKEGGEKKKRKKEKNLQAAAITFFIISAFLRAEDSERN